MPPYLAIPYFHLSKLPLTTKLMLTFFSASLVAAIIFVGITFYPSRTAEEEEGIKNFSSKKDESLPGLKADFAKHQLVEANEEMAEGLKEADRKHAYMVIHPHSFLMPVIYFILSHLCEMTTLYRSIKLFLYAGAFISMMLSIFAPLLIFTSTAFAPVCHIAFYVMLVSFLIMIVVPNLQMWSGSRVKTGK